MIVWPALCAVALGLAMVFAAASVVEAGGRSEVYLKLGVRTAFPGEEVRLPLRLRSLPRVDVGAVGTSIRFDPTKLEFVSAEPGRVLGRVRGDVIASQRRLASDQAVLRLGVVTHDPRHFGTRLPNGVVAWVTFRIREGTARGRLLLEHVPEAASTGVPTAGIAEVRAIPGRIRVRRTKLRFREPGKRNGGSPAEKTNAHD